jgi:hypothetical protein
MTLSRASCPAVKKITTSKVPNTPAIRPLVPLEINPVSVAKAPTTKVGIAARIIRLWLVIEISLSFSS